MKKILLIFLFAVSFINNAFCQEKNKLHLAKFQFEASRIGEDAFKYPYIFISTCGFKYNKIPINISIGKFGGIEYGNSGPLTDNALNGNIFSLNSDFKMINTSIFKFNLNYGVVYGIKEIMMNDITFNDPYSSLTFSHIYYEKSKGYGFSFALLSYISIYKNVDIMLSAAYYNIFDTFNYLTLGAGLTYNLNTK